MMKLQAQAEALIASKSQSALNKIRQLMAEHGLTTADIDAHGGTVKAGAKRGPKPGFKRAGKSAAAAPGGRVATQAKGKLPPKYLNPKTGETWSGYARPPAWIKDVKDRTRFLIEGASAVTTESSAVNKASKPNAAGKSGAAAKKAAAKKVATTKVAPAKKTVVAKKVMAKKAPATKAMVAASNMVAAKKTVAPAARKVAVNKAPAKKAVAKTVVAKPDVAAAPASVTVQATA
jgi:DNA-binding protein H-NS